MIKLGVNSVLFGKFDYATAAKRIAQAGYDGIELSALKGMGDHLNLDAWKAQKDDLKKITADNGLEFLSMEVAMLDEGRLMLAYEAAAEIGVPIVNIGSGGKSNVQEDLDASIEKMQAMAEKAGEFGVVLACKAHVGSAIFNTETTLYAMDKIKSKHFGIDMDPSHIFRAGEAPEEALASVLPRMKHIHIRDCKSATEGLAVNPVPGRPPMGASPGTPPMQACGRGDINLMGYCKAMVDAKYDGPVCLEVIGASMMTSPYNEVESSIIAAESYGYLNACLKSLGAR